MFRALEKKRDQSYFLYRLTQEQLKDVIMPLGQYTKDEVRLLAQSAGLDIANKKDSQDFYSGDINDILKQSPKVGNFITSDGKILGQHKGIWNYTIGQRKGMGLAAERPLYVIDIRPQTNEIVVGFEEESACHGLIADGINWVSSPEITDEVCVQAKVRSAQEPFDVRVKPLENGRYQVDFNEPQKAVAIGQSVVFYEKNIVLGGGFIVK